MVLEAIKGSLVEIEEVGGADGHRLRKLTDWQSWVMTESERSSIAAMSAAGVTTTTPGFAGASSPKPPSTLSRRLCPWRS